MRTVSLLSAFSSPSLMPETNGQRGARLGAICWIDQITSSAPNVLPLWNVTPGRSLTSQTVASLLCVHASARPGAAREVGVDEHERVVEVLDARLVDRRDAEERVERLGGAAADEAGAQRAALLGRGGAAGAEREVGDCHRADRGGGRPSQQGAARDARVPASFVSGCRSVTGSPSEGTISRLDLSGLLSHTHTTECQIARAGISLRRFSSAKGRHVEGTLLAGPVGFSRGPGRHAGRRRSSSVTATPASCCAGPTAR